MTVHKANTQRAQPGGERSSRPLPPKVLRARLEATLDILFSAAERAIAELDAIDGDPDLEPSLGAIEAHHAFADQRHAWEAQRPAVHKVGCELVDVDDNEHDGRQPDVEDEPSLGWTSTIDQTRTTDLNLDALIDTEEQCEDEGGQCDDEGADTDSEPDDFHTVPTYEGEAVGDQTKPILCWG